MRERIYLLNETQELELLYGTPFAQEDDLQRLIERHPELIDGEQIDPADPRRWILVAREVGIADAPGAANRWSIDHLLIDQDAVPTLVEVKRSADTRIRREVVGQMLDYAAHASETWSVDDIRQFFEEGARGRGWNPETKLVDLLQPAGELDADAFWDRVAANLQIKRLRLLFVADRIPDELKCIVEFLNEQMPGVEVLAVELMQYPGVATRTVVPRVFGRGLGGGGSRKNQDVETFLHRFADEDTRNAAELLLEEAGARGAILSGQRQMSIRATSPLWHNPITICRLTPPGKPMSLPIRSNHFLFGMFPSWVEGGLPTLILESLKRWRDLFASTDGFEPVPDPWNSKEPRDYGYIPCHAISHEDAVQQVEWLCRELGRCIDELGKLAEPLE